MQWFKASILRHADYDDYYDGGLGQSYTNMMRTGTDNISLDEDEYESLSQKKTYIMIADSLVQTIHK